MIPLKSKRTVWLRDVGPHAVGACALGCGQAISIPEAVRKSLRWPAGKLEAPVAHFGHVRARSRGGSCAPRNLRAICPRCNLRMGVADMDAWARAGGPRGAGNPQRASMDRMDIDQVDDPQGCVGVTVRGGLCRNRALLGDVYCAVHRGRG